MRDDVDATRARARDGLDQGLAHRHFLAAVVIVAGRACLAAPVRAQDFGGGISARSQAVVGGVEVGRPAGVAVHQHDSVQTGG